MTGLRSQVAPDSASKHGRRFNLPYEIKTAIDRRDQLLTFKNRHDGAVLITRELSRAMEAAAPIRSHQAGQLARLYDADNVDVL